MSLFVDTSVWSLALRRKPGDLNPHEQRLTRALAELIRDGRASILGVIRQELLSGIRDAGQFEKLRGYLRALPSGIHTEWNRQRSSGPVRQVPLPPVVGAAAACHDALLR